jgi:hypothetical protein
MGLTRRVLATEPEGARRDRPPHSRLIGMVAGPTCVFVFSTFGPGVPPPELVAAFDEVLLSLRPVEAPSSAGSGGDEAGRRRLDP